MMLKRKAEQRINHWIKHPLRALLVSGARQVGKTFTIRKCLKENNCDYVEINLLQNREYIYALEQANTIDDLKLNLSALQNVSFADNRTILFIDEVQECREIVTKIKFWVDDGRLKFILSGSLLGVELRNIRSAPVGYLDEIDMFPMDFEEFILASGVTEETVAYLKDCYALRKPVSEVVNSKMFTHLNRYLVVGGMPAAVNEYVETGNIWEVSLIQESILRQYRLDFTKYETEDKKLMLLSIFNQVPTQLMKQNKRFNYADIQKGLRFERLEDSFLWLKYAGVVLATINTTEPRIALLQNAKNSLLKLYSSDVGLLTNQYGTSFRNNILFNIGGINLGGVYENFVAQELTVHGYPSYFYCNHNLGEIDFLIEHEGCALPIEVKSGKDYYVHSAITKAVNNKEYQTREGFVLANCNIEVKDKIVYFPVYMCAFICDRQEYPVLSLNI